jgi:hypothetical protein
MAEDDNVVIEGLGKGKINYGLVVMFHLDRICKSTSEPLALDERSKDTFFNAVRGLDAILSPYKNDEYEKEKKVIMALSDPADSIASIDEYWLWFGLLVKLIGRAGLLPAEEVKLMDDYEQPDFIVD